ncbi:MAG: Nif3-like dinuclear metal center hexameric protein [Candidatus Kapabacteria bacterium]|nr:Nif3-like dinuclear metal center hexameric protein [Ignavibacteriota bacterium]MCW5885747.1 Nif3-like dinuclear metal center hexameric protein [Candidatus Kapabacteria bacterium]
MLLSEIIETLEREFPGDTILDGDRTGLQLGRSLPQVSKILTAYELTDEVADEAKNAGVELIISFHPLIYFPLRSIQDEERVGKILRKLILSDIALYVIHTNFDTHRLGTNNIIADKLNLSDRRMLAKSDQGKNNAIGIVGNLPESLTTDELAKLLSEIFSASLKFTNGKSDIINSVAIVGGSGSSFLDNALNSGADAYITADLTYHLFHAVKGKMALFDIGHYEMEQFNSAKMFEIISNLFEKMNLKITLSSINTNPVNYFYIQNRNN